MDSLDTLRRILIANELGGHTGLAYRFSDPDGPLRSGYSFGVCQFDLRHNFHAGAILEACGFTLEEIDDLVVQTCDQDELSRLNAKLFASAAVVDSADAEEIGSIVSHTLRVIVNAGLHLAGEDVFFHLADYHNQFRLDYDGKAVRHFRPFGRPITAADILEYKLATAWGRKRPDDVKRRWNNIVRICTEET